MEPHVVLSRSAARELLAALLGPGYLIRELQAIGDLDPHNPIVVLREAVERPADYVPADYVSADAIRAEIAWHRNAERIAREKADRAGNGPVAFTLGFVADAHAEAAERLTALLLKPAQEEQADAE